MVLQPSFKNFIVLTESDHVHQVCEILHKEDPTKNILRVDSLSELMVLSVHFLQSARLIAFLTKVIVPQDILEKIGYGAYNFHPGPYQYLGWAPFSFALYQGETSHGTTVHEMIAEVDAGPIIAMEEYPIRADLVQSDLEAICLESCFKMLARLTKIFCQASMPIPLNTQWGKVKTKQLDFKKICTITPSISKKEFHRRLKAFGAGDGKYRLFLKDGERRYELDIQKDQEAIDQYRLIHGVKFALVK